MAATFQYFPYDTGAGAAVKGDRWREMFSWMRSNGVVTTDIVLNTTVSDLAVTPGTGLQVRVAEGDFFIQGTFFIQTGNFAELAIAANSSGNPRIDLIVVSADFVANTTTYAVLQGTPAGSPVAPTPTQSSTLWQEPLYRLAVANGASSFITANLTDVRVRSVQDSTGVTLTSEPGDESLVSDAVGPNLGIKALSAGANITLTSNADEVTIEATGSGGSVTLTNAGTTSLVNDGVGPDLANKGLVAGAGISFGTSATDVTITNSDLGSSVTLANAGTTSLVNDGTGPSLATKGLVAGTNISFSTSATDVTINASGGSSAQRNVCILRNSGTTALPSGAVTLPWDTVELDPDGMFDSMMSVYVINILEDGIYQLAASVQNDGSNSGDYYLNIYINNGGAVLVAQDSIYITPATYYAFLGCTRLITLEAGDFVYCTMFSSGVGNIIATANSAPVFSVMKLSDIPV